MCSFSTGMVSKLEYVTENNLSVIILHKNNNKSRLLLLHDTIIIQ